MDEAQKQAENMFIEDENERVWFKLAWQMGIPVAELKERISPQEFTEWKAYLHFVEVDRAVREGGRLKPKPTTQLSINGRVFAEAVAGDMEQAISKRSAMKYRGAEANF